MFRRRTGAGAFFPAPAPAKKSGSDRLRLHNTAWQIDILIDWYFNTGLGKRSFQKNVLFLRSFPFIENDRFVLYVHFRSVEMNVSFTTFISFISVRLGPKMNAKNERHVHFCSIQLNSLFTAFISVQYKWTFRSLHSFPFSRNERFVHCVHFRSVQMNVSFTAFISVH